MQSSRKNYSKRKLSQAETLKKNKYLRPKNRKILIIEENNHLFTGQLHKK